MTVAASEVYNTGFEAALSASLGVTFTARPDTLGGREPVREITGVPLPMIEFFSRRRAAIEGRYAELVRDYRSEHGHDPDAGASHRLARQANLDTRQGKKPPRSLGDKRAGWREELTGRFGAGAAGWLMRAVPSSPVAEAASGVPSAADLSDLAERTVASVAACLPPGRCGTSGPRSLATLPACRARGRCRPVPRGGRHGAWPGRRARACC
jgi:TrwC relaxase